MSYVVQLWPQRSLPVVGSKDCVPVRRIFRIGRNYVERQNEMAGDELVAGINLLSELRVSVAGMR